MRKESRVEEWEVDAAFDPASIYWEVSLNSRTGSVWCIDRHEEAPKHWPLNFFERSSQQEHDGDGWRWDGWVQAPTQEAAVKIAQEHLAMALAQEAGMG